MNLSTCSGRLRICIEYLNDHLQANEALRILDSAKFYSVYQYSPERAIECLRSVEEVKDSVRRNALDHPIELSYLAAVSKENDVGPVVTDYLDSVRDYYWNHQSNSGKIQSEFSGTEGPFLFLSIWDSEDPRLKRSAEFIPDQAEFRNTSEDVLQLSLAILGLAEWDYFGYGEKIESLGKQFVKELQATDKLGVGSFEQILLAKEPLRCMSVISGDQSQLIDRLSSRYPKPEIEDGDLYFKGENGDRTKASQRDVGEYIIGLRHTGEGISVPKVDAEWNLRKQQMRSSRNRAQFRATIPSTTLEGRSTGIYDKVLQMIDAANSEIRISTLRMDMLHNELVDKIENTNIDIRIVTNTGTPSSNRRKMKKAVMNELVKRTEGGVREHELNHARFVIQDDDAVLISSADLTRDQLYDEFNPAVFTHDPDVVSRCAEFSKGFGKTLTTAA